MSLKTMKGKILSTYEMYKSKLEQMEKYPFILRWLYFIKQSVLSNVDSFYKISKEITLFEESRQIDAKVHIERKTLNDI